MILMLGLFSVGSTMCQCDDLKQPVSLPWAFSSFSGSWEGWRRLPQPCSCGRREGTAPRMKPCPVLGEWSLALFPPQPCPALLNDIIFVLTISPKLDDFLRVM